MQFPNLEVIHDDNRDRRSPNEEKNRHEIERFFIEKASV